MHGLSLELLEEVAQPAHNPAAMPSKAKIERQTTRLNERFANIAKAEARRAEEAAERAEAAAEAGPSTVNITNNITNNNITNNNIHVHEPPPKRVCKQSSISGFLKRGV